MCGQGRESFLLSYCPPNGKWWRPTWSVRGIGLYLMKLQGVQSSAFRVLNTHLQQGCSVVGRPSVTGRLKIVGIWGMDAIHSVNEAVVPVRGYTYSWLIWSSHRFNLVKEESLSRRDGEEDKARGVRYCYSLCRECFEFVNRKWSAIYKIRSHWRTQGGGVLKRVNNRPPLHIWKNTCSLYVNLIYAFIFIYRISIVSVRVTML